jgi:Pyruvate/2-oxoacid:ferredoxin oxidoreductase gamma subunit
MIEESMAARAKENGEIKANQRPEYGKAYREMMASLRPITKPPSVEAKFTPPERGLRSVVILGSAGQRVLTAGELVGLAGLSAGLQVTQKNEYNITVLRGPSISELILSPEPIDYTGIKNPDVVLALAAEGVTRRKDLFGDLGPESLVIQAAKVDLPPTKATVKTIDFKALGIKTVDYSLAGVAALAKMNRVLSMEMMQAAMALRYKGKIMEMATEVVAKVVV